MGTTPTLSGTDRQLRFRAPFAGHGPPQKMRERAGSSYLVAAFLYIPGGDPVQYVIHAMESRPMRYRASIVLDGSPAEMEGRLRPREGELEPMGADRSPFHTQEDALAWLAVRLLWLGVDFDIREPPELVDYVRNLAARLAGSMSANDR